MEYVYTLCVVTGVRFLTRTISLRNMNSPCVATGATIRWVYSYGIYTRRVYSRGGALSPELFLFRNNHPPGVVTRARIRRVYS